MKEALKFSAILFLLCSTTTLFLSYCSPKPGKAINQKPAAISYAKDILPVMQAKCTPCHFPETGNKELLNTMAATQSHIDDIIRRVSLAVDERGYMPFKSKKQAFTIEEIVLFKKWKEEGFGK